MYGKVIIAICVASATISMAFGAPHRPKTEQVSTTSVHPEVSSTIKPQTSKLEEVHVCVPSDSCDPKNVVGIKLEYTCSCNPGYAGQYCDQSNGTGAAQKSQSFVDLTRSKDAQMFYCEYQTTSCVNGVTVIQAKNPICG